MASEGYHEPLEQLDARSRNRHRAIVSIAEELEAIDWYDQRVQATDDPDLAAVLAHNRDEEKEHAALAIEWLRRNDEVFDRHLRRYLFTRAPANELVEEDCDVGGVDEVRSAAPSAPDAGSSLGIGSLATNDTHGKDAL